METSYDLAVIGGGINGAAIARDAALRGLKVILLEKTDFGSGASTKTSKLAHGGLRYLEQFEFGLVKEALHERNLLLKNAPHLVQPLKFILPVYKNDIRPLWQIDLGLYLYDFFARNSKLPTHSKLSDEQIIKSFPTLYSENLVGGCSYYDAQMKDNRLVIENVLAAEQAGADVFNYAVVTNFLQHGEHIEGVVFRHEDTHSDIAIKSKLVVNATGAWSNSISAIETDVDHCQVAPTKGVHLVIPKVCDEGLILRAPRDGRIFFVLPWEKCSLIGTTDTFFCDDPETVKVDDMDIDYLLEAFCHYFPHADINRDSIISTFAGLRPLAYNNHSKSPSSVSRDYIIELSKGGLITVIGGKFTTYRHIAEEAVNIAIKQMDPSRKFEPCCTKEVALPGAILKGNNLKQELEQVGLNETQIEHLFENYGQLAWHILDIIRDHPKGSQQICPEHPHIFAELMYAIKFEHVKKPEDWFYRRTSIGYSSCQGKHCYEKVAESLYPITYKK